MAGTKLCVLTCEWLLLYPRKKAAVTRTAGRAAYEILDWAP